MKMKIYHWFPLFFCVLQCVAADPVQLELNTFATPAELQKCTAKEGAAISADTFLINGSPSAKLHFPVSDQWPGLIITAEQMPTTDWQDYDYLVLDVYNPTDYPIELRMQVRFKGPYEQLRKSDLFNLNSGINQCRFYLTDDIRMFPIEEAHLYLHKPQSPLDLYLANWRLVTRDFADKQRELQLAASELRYPANSMRAPQEVIDVRNEYAKMITAIRQTAQEAQTTEELLPALRQARQLAADPDLGKLGIIANQYSAEENRDLGSGSEVSTRWSNSIDRIYRTERLLPDYDREDNIIKLAQNEAEANQLLLFSLKDLTDVSVELAGDLKDGNGNLFPATAIKVMPVGYVNTRQPDYYTPYAGWTPDPLLNYLDHFDLPQLTWQPIWVEAAAAAEQTPGLYVGELRIRANELQSPIKVPLQVLVWNFRLPSTNSLPLAIASIFERSWFKTFYGGKDPAVSGAEFDRYLRGELTEQQLSADARQLVEMMKRYETEIRSCRIPIDLIYRPYPISERELEQRIAEGNTNICLFFISQFSELNHSLEWLKQLKPIIDQHDCWDRVYVYGFDEVPTGQIAEVREAMGKLKAAYPKLRLMTTAIDYSFGLDTQMDDAIDIWVPLTTRYIQFYDAVEAARKRGKEVWYYVCLVPQPPSANWLLESPATGTRLLTGFMAEKLHTQGFLHYSIVRWNTFRDQTDAAGKVVRQPTDWSDYIQGGPLTNQDGKGYGDVNGDGFLLYPGVDGPVPSQRLKLVRDGLEDYEYLQLLKYVLREAETRRIQLTKAQITQIQDLLDIKNHLVANDWDYTRNGAELMQLRNKIGEILNEIGDNTKIKW